MFLRLIGVDKEALDAQVTERNNMNSADTARDDAYAREMIKNDKLGVLYQERQDRDARELQKVIFKKFGHNFINFDFGAICKFRILAQFSNFSRF